MSTILIEPAIVHKNSATDVLLRQPRTPMPLNMLANMEKGTDQLSHSPLLKLYCSEKGGTRRFDISAHSNKGIQISPALRSNDVFYEEWDESRAVPFQALPEMVLANRESTQLVSDNLQTEIYNLFHDVPGLPRASSFEFINTADNYFFYRKPHEHVPGTMIIEAARQACYYHTYKETGFVKSDVTITLDELNSKFFAYAELMYPIEIIVDEIKSHEPEKPGKLLFRASFYQRGRLFAVVDSKVHVIDMGTFKKMRNIFLFADDWYRPIDPLWIASKTLDDTGRESKVDLLGVSKSGCITSLPDLDHKTVRSVQISGNNSVEFSATTLSADNGFLMLKFDNMKAEDMYDLGELIKRSFVHMEQTLETELVDNAC